MNQSKPVAIVLGGTFPHAELIRRLKRRGYYTLLIDYFDDPPAAKYADEHSTASAMDFDVVLGIAKERRAALVMSCCLDQQLNIAMKVSEELGLPHPFSSETALMVTNKKLMKKILTENGIPTARYYHIDKSVDIDSIDIDFPVMVKPADSCGSAGVRRIDTRGELKDAVAFACSMSRTKDAIVEEYMEGKEVAAYTYIKNGRAIVCSYSHRISVIDGEKAKCFAVTNPAVISDKAKENIEKVATQIAQAFGLNNTPMFFQSRVKGDEVRIIEFSPRIGGGTGYHIIELSSGFDMLEASIASYLGEDFQGVPEPTGRFLIMQQIFARDGVFDRIDGADELIAEGLINELCMLKTHGSEISNEKVSGGKIAVAFVIGSVDNRDECLERLEKAWKRLRVLGMDGSDLTDREYYLTRDIYYENN